MRDRLAWGFLLFEIRPFLALSCTRPFLEVFRVMNASWQFLVAEGRFFITIIPLVCKMLRIICTCVYLIEGRTLAVLDCTLPNWTALYRTLPYFTGLHSTLLPCWVLPGHPLDI